jgi:hypothetical protein
MISLLSAGISGLVLGAFGMAAWVLISRHKLETVDTEIRSLGARHPGWIAGRGNYQRLDEALNFIFGEAHQNEIILLVKGADGTVLHTSPGWPADLPPASLDSRLEDDPNALTVGYGSGRARGGMGRGMGPGGGGGQVTFTKIPRFQTVMTSRGEWRLGMLGTADTTLVIGLNYANPNAPVGNRDAQKTDAPCLWRFKGVRRDKSPGEAFHEPSRSVSRLWPASRALCGALCTASILCTLFRGKRADAVCGARAGAVAQAVTIAPTGALAHRLSMPPSLSARLAGDTRSLTLAGLLARRLARSQFVYPYPEQDPRVVIGAGRFQRNDNQTGKIPASESGLCVIFAAPGRKRLNLPPTDSGNVAGLECRRRFSETPGRNPAAPPH